MEVTFKGSIVTGTSIILGLIFGVVAFVYGLYRLFYYMREYFSRHIESLDSVFAPAYAAGDIVHTPVFSGELKSVILSGIFVALFVLFIWALFTLSKSPNPKAVDVAGEAIKTLAGFFIGALTGFLGA